MSEPLHETQQDHAIRIALLEQSMLGIKEELSKINTSINTLVKVVGGAIVVAVMNFIIRGGLA